nr:hypothetical protein [Tanacetum cinerariifolium]
MFARERGFLSQKGSGVGRGVKEKQVLIGVKLVDRTKSSTNAGTGLFSESDGTLNDANPLKEETIAMECPVVNTPDVGPNPPLPMQEANSASNAPGKPSYATATGKPNGKKVSVRTLFTPGGNEIDMVVPMDLFVLLVHDLLILLMIFSWERRWHTLLLLTISMDGLDPILENGPWFIWNNPLIQKKLHPDENLLKEDVSTVPVWVKLHGVPIMAFSEDVLSRSSYARVMIELRADVELKDNIVVAMPKITKEGHYTCNDCVEYEWKPPKCSSCKVFGHIHEECPKNTGAGEKKTVKKPSQTSEGVPIGPKMGFKPQKNIELNSNPFDVLNSVDNDVEFGTNRRTTNFVNNGDASSGSSFMNIDNDGQFASNTSIGEKIDKIERQIMGLLQVDHHDITGGEESEVSWIDEVL